MRKWVKGALLFVALMALAFPAHGGPSAPPDYEKVSQADLISNRDAYVGKKVEVTGPFLFTGSDFCYQIRKTKIVTKDYFCFALGPTGVVRLYLKKDHPQADELLQVKKGLQVRASGTFDSTGADFNYLIVDEFKVEPAG